MILVAVAPSGELLTLRPVYFRHTTEALVKVDRYHMFLENEKDPPVGYAVETREGGKMFGSGILKLVEVLGEL